MVVCFMDNNKLSFIFGWYGYLHSGEKMKGTEVLILSAHYSCTGCMIVWNASHEGVVYAILASKGPT